MGKLEHCTGFQCLITKVHAWAEENLAVCSWITLLIILSILYVFQLFTSDFTRWTNDCLPYGMKSEAEYRLAGYKFHTKFDVEMTIVPAIIFLCREIIWFTRQIFNNNESRKPCSYVVSTGLALVNHHPAISSLVFTQLLPTHWCLKSNSDPPLAVTLVPVRTITFLTLILILFATSHLSKDSLIFVASHTSIRLNGFLYLSNFTTKHILAASCSYFPAYVPPPYGIVKKKKECLRIKFSWISCH
jgi:hypothetical protein